MSNKELTFKLADVSRKLSVYGVQSRPITLAPSQWKAIFAAQAEILAFAEENKGKFANGE